MAQKSSKTDKVTPRKPEPTRHSAPAAPAAPRGAEPHTKASLILVGADKGGVGKTTISRALLDYLTSSNIPTRAFDTEWPRGTLHRFHPDEATIVDITSTADQMLIIDTLNTTDVKVSVIDVRAGGLTVALQALQDTGFLDAVHDGEFNFIVFHVIGSSISSLDEIEEIAPYVEDAHYFLVKNHVNDTTFFEWDPVTHRKYFEKVVAAGDITIPKLNEMSYEQVEIAGTPFSTFVSNRLADGTKTDHSFVLRGYVRTWLIRIAEEFDRVGLLDMIIGKNKKQG
jgi:hypothetical protein